MSCCRCEFFFCISNAFCCFSFNKILYVVCVRVGSNDMDHIRNSLKDLKCVLQILKWFAKVCSFRQVYPLHPYANGVCQPSSCNQLNYTFFLLCPQYAFEFQKDMKKTGKGHSFSIDNSILNSLSLSHSLLKERQNATSWIFNYFHFDKNWSCQWHTGNLR